MTKVKYIPITDLATIGCDQQGRFSKKTIKRTARQNTSRLTR
ncbi:hypothetical protein ND16A_3364 [Thalassotalea sp. ND16A]|nr:hypothetical protein ND16A_3364 [Thalassotalea sp. ND16A]